MTIKQKALRSSVGLAVLLLQQGVHAQVAEPTSGSTIDEIVIMGRLRTAADNVVIERRESSVVADFIDSTFISRVGDSNIAVALRRVPGVSVVDDKFIYVRGLGERYSSSLLNGARVPSPDLTRNVLPLDIFPVSVVKSLAVQKGFSASMPAHFSGGLVDIRTQSIPAGLEYSLQVGTAGNSETTGNVWGYQGGGRDWLGTDDGTRALPAGLTAANELYLGNISPAGIQAGQNKIAPFTLEQAAALNRELATQLNRNVDVGRESRDPDYNINLSAGNSFDIGNDLTVGFVGGGWLDRDTRSRESFAEFLDTQPEVPRFTRQQYTTTNVSVTGHLGLGLSYMEDHKIETTSLFLRNTDNRSGLNTIYGYSNDYSQGDAFHDLVTRFEQRELKVNQIRGTHTLGQDTLDTRLIPGFLGFLEGLEVGWFYSDATSTTDIPNESRVRYAAIFTPGTDIFQRRFVKGDDNTFGFGDLNDLTRDYGWNLKFPIEFGRNHSVTFSGGGAELRKSRDFLQYTYNLIGQGDSNLDGPPSQALSDSILTDPNRNFRVLQSSTLSSSYLAGMVNSAAWGEVDVLLNETWRITAGARWEDFSQAGLQWDALDYQGCQITCDPDELAAAVFKQDDYYPSLALTWIKQDFWAEEFQLRLNYSETLVRPDMREITETPYLDPITNNYVRGNSRVVPSDVVNYDLRGEWFFDSGDNFTLSLFYKEIKNPIDIFEEPIADDKKLLGIGNGASANVQGLEVEWHKQLGTLSEVLDPFFLSGNFVVLNSEMSVDPNFAPTSAVRPLLGASDALNLNLAYDSPNGMHSAMLSFNMFTDRLYSAGRLGAPDAFEQPFKSLDLTYFWYPIENMSVRLRAQNILDETVRIKQENLIMYEEKPGTTFSVDVRWRY
jgi:outer membrane receptor protein involved in Fe transport